MNTFSVNFHVWFNNSFKAAHIYESLLVVAQWLIDTWKVSPSLLSSMFIPQMWCSYYITSLWCCYSDDHVITVPEDEVQMELKRVNVRKAAGPDGITGRVLRSCSDQLAGLFTSLFNESLATSVVPTCLKKSIIIPVPKNNKPACLNDYNPVALTSIVMKVFERLV